MQIKMIRAHVMRSACRLDKKGQYFQQLLMPQQYAAGDLPIPVGHQGQGGRRHQGFYFQDSPIMTICLLSPDCSI
jgi:hypothetical protein